jgi:hypothetical protein
VSRIDAHIAGDTFSGDTKRDRLLFPRSSTAVGLTIENVSLFVIRSHDDTTDKGQHKRLHSLKADKYRKVQARWWFTEALFSFREGGMKTDGKIILGGQTSSEKTDCKRQTRSH